MTKLVYGLFVALAITDPAPSYAKSPSAPATSGRCVSLSSDWRQAEIDLSDNQAEGVTDNSAPRATMRAAQDTATYAKAALTLRLMELNRCTTPARPPSGATYLLEALKCRTAQMGATIEKIRAGLPECDRTKWAGAK